MMRGMILEAQIPPYWDEKSKRKPGVNIEKTMERSTIFNGKIRKDPPFLMGKSPFLIGNSTISMGHGFSSKLLVDRRVIRKHHPVMSILIIEVSIRIRINIVINTIMVEIRLTIIEWVEGNIDRNCPTNLTIKTLFLVWIFPFKPIH